MKKTICAVLSALLILSCFTAGGFAKTAGTELKFNENGEFRIMCFADSQDDENLEETTTAIMREAIKKYKPDLVIFLGDNTVAKGYDNQKTAIEAVTLPCRESSTPYAIVFGNHDEEQGVSKEDLLEIYRNLGCLTFDAVPEMYGCGTCNLPILSSDGTKTVFNIWLTDSGSYNTDSDQWGYDYIHPDQIEWYKATAEALKAANGGKAVPSMNFQHIVIPEIYDELFLEVPFRSDALTYNYNGKSYFKLPVFHRLHGYWLEECCPPKDYDGQLDAWVEEGDVIAAFHGHDHDNSYETNIKGVDIINVPTVGCSAYSKAVTRGCGLITLNEKNPAKYKYELVHMYDLALEKDSVISEVQGGESRAYYATVKIWDAFVSMLINAIAVIPDAVKAVTGITC